MNAVLDFPKLEVVSFEGVTIDHQTNLFHVGSRSIEVDHIEAALIGGLIRSDLDRTGLIKSAGLPSISVFEQIYNNLMTKLEGFAIANEGGIEPSFFEDTIFARDLFIIEGDFYSLNKPLAELITDKPLIGAQELDIIKYQPYWYKPKGLV